MRDPKQVASIAYTRTAREVGDDRIHVMKSDHAIELYEDCLVTSTGGQRPLDEVWDVSCKFFSNNSGLLYLHTNQGVFTYEIEADPEPFLDAFRQVKGRV